MPQAVQGIFASMTSAPAVRPSSPQASDGSGGAFQNMLDQAQPKNSQQDNTQANNTSSADSSNNSTTDASDSDKKARRNDHAKSHAAHPVQRKLPAKGAKQVDGADSADPSADVSKESIPQVPLSEQPTIELPKATETPEKPQEKKKPETGATPEGEAQQALAADNKTKVQAIKPQNRQQSDSKKDPSKRQAAKSVEAIASPDSSAGQSDPAAQAVSTNQSATNSQAAKSSKSPSPSNGTKEKLAVQPTAQSEAARQNANTAAASAQAASTTDATGAGDPAAVASVSGNDPISDKVDGASTHATAHADAGAFSDVLNAAQASAGTKAHAFGSAIAPSPADAPPAPPEAQFAEANHATIVSGIHGQLLPTGGNMQIRLDPPELGALSVVVRVHGGVMSASFETSNDQATRLLSHSLSQLKTSLESQGISVGKLHVQQSPRDQKSDSQTDGRQPQDSAAQDHPAQREQQRREMLRRMWRRLSGGSDPLDLVA